MKRKLSSSQIYAIEVLYHGDGERSVTDNGKVQGGISGINLNSHTVRSLKNMGLVGIDGKLTEKGKEAGKVLLKIN